MTQLHLAHPWALALGPCLLALAFAFRLRVMRKPRPAITPDWRAPVVIKPRPRSVLPL